MAVIRQIGTGLKWTSKTLLEVTRFGEGAADVLQAAKKCLNLRIVLFGDGLNSFVSPPSNNGMPLNQLCN